MKQPSTRLRQLIFLLLCLAFPTANAQNNCQALAGTITVDVGPVCLHNGQATLSGTTSGTAVEPDGYTSAYLLTRTNGLIIEQISPVPAFTVNSVDVWRIHRLVYNPLALDLGVIQPGTTTAYQLQAMLVQGGGSICASLSMTNAAVKTMECGEPCTAHASGMTMDSTTVCLQNGHADLAASPTGNNIIPPGYQQAFLLTRTNGLIIAQVSTTPSFTVTSVDVWRIHNLVYDPSSLNLSVIVPGTTTAYDLQAQLVQGGGSICASLDISGAPVKTGDCYTPCTADAGLASADNPDQCLTEGVAVLAASQEGGATVPAGYALVYILTEGVDPQVVQATSATPEFTVHHAGAYSIHAFVHNPSTFNLGSLVPGITTLMDLNALLMQGGGGICASLDLDGADFQVVDCTPTCAADAGTLTTDDPAPCLMASGSILTAVSAGDTLVPPGFITRYLLSTGTSLTIVGIATTPYFEVSDTGLFHIHGFVFNPSTFSLNSLIMGTTGIHAVNSLLQQGGGSLCGSLDILGAQYQVYQCPPPCNAGLDSVITVCYSAAPFQLFNFLGGHPCPGGAWTHPANPVVNGTFHPASDAAGVYTYTVTDPFGFTGTATVTVNVVECPGTCTGAGTDNTVTVCNNAPVFLLFGVLGGNPCPGGQWASPNGQAFGPYFHPGVDPAGTYIYTVQTATGANNAIVIVNVVECPDGFTGQTGMEGSTSGSTGIPTAPAMHTFTPWPNPATDRLWINLPFNAAQVHSMEMIDAAGRACPAKVVQVGGNEAVLDVRELAAGAWTLRIISNRTVLTGRFVRAK